MVKAIEEVPTVSALTVEALFTWALTNRVTPTLKTKLKKVGVDLDRSLLPAYTNDVWNQAVRCTIEELFPGTPPQKASFEIGKMLMVEGMPATLLGRAAVQLGRLIGPERSLMRVQRNHRTTNNFTTAELKKLGPTHFRIEAGILPEFLRYMKDDSRELYGPMNHGMYTGLLTLLRVKNPKVSWREVDAATYRTEYDLEWDPG